MSTKTQPSSPPARSRPRAAVLAADLHTSARAVRETSRRIVRELGFLRGRESRGGLSVSQCHALVELGVQGALSGAQLAQLLMLDKSTTSRALAPLVRRRYVRVGVASADRRSKVYTLTATGRARVGKVDASADAQVLGALAALGEDERAAAVRGLALYAKALERARRRAGVVVRRIRARDNAAVARVIRTVMPEFGATGPGFAIVDPEVDDMAGTYRGRAAYFVAEQGGDVLGGAGVGPLPQASEDVCELKKMYLLGEARGLGVGQALLDAALSAARELGYRRCYLETLCHMEDARRLYERNGFTLLPGPMGATGHFGCNTFYLRELQ